MKNQDNGERRESRVSIINNVRTVLGFFVLALLVVEGLCIYVLGLIGEGTDRTIVIIGMFIILALIIVIVALLAYLRPGNLGGQPASPDIGLRAGVTRNDKTDIAGVYLAGGDPNFVVTVTRLTGDYYKLSNPAWEGAGFFDGKYYYGAFKHNDAAYPRERRGNWGLHRAELLSEGPSKGSFRLFGIEFDREKHQVGGFSDEVIGWVKKNVDSV